MRRFSWTRRSVTDVHLPEPPTNVRYVFPDGSEIGCELVYVGFNEDTRTHQWRATATMPNFTTGVQVAMDTLPAHTSVAFEVRTADDRVLFKGPGSMFDGDGP